MSVWLRSDPSALPKELSHWPVWFNSPVELVVVVMRLPPEVEPDEQQTEGEEEDEGPQKLPLQEKNKKQNTYKNKILIPF